MLTDLLNSNLFVGRRASNSSSRGRERNVRRSFGRTSSDTLECFSIFPTNLKSRRERLAVLKRSMYKQVCIHSMHVWSLGHCCENFSFAFVYRIQTFFRAQPHVHVADDSLSGCGVLYVVNLIEWNPQLQFTLFPAGVLLTYRLLLS